MPQENRRQNLPAKSAPAARTQNNQKKPTGKKRRAMRTAEFKAVSQAPRIHMRRPRPRRHAPSMTAQFGKVSPRRAKKQTGIRAIGAISRKGVQTVRVRSARFPWAAFFTALICTLLIMAMVFNYVRLNELTNEYRSLQNQTVTLASSRKKLMLALEQKNDLLAFEKEAVLFGMVKSDRVEKRYIRIENEDKIEVSGGGTGAITKFFDDARAYVSELMRNIFG